MVSWCNGGRGLLGGRAVALAWVCGALWVSAAHAAAPEPPADPALSEQPPPFSGFEAVPWLKFTNSAFVSDFDGKWIRVEAEFAAATSASVLRLPETARGQNVAGAGDVFFTVRPIGGSPADEFTGVYIAKELSDPLFSMSASQRVVLYGLGRRLVVTGPGQPPTSSEFTLLKVVQLEQVGAGAPPAPAAVVKRNAAPEAGAPAATAGATTPRVPWVIFGSKPEPGAEGVGGTERTIALSMGTGPLPLNTLTLGLSGLAARVMFPKGTLVPFVSLALNSGKATEDDGGGLGKSFNGATTVTASGGIRVDGGARLKGVAIPYGIGAAMLSHATLKDGQVDPDALDKTGMTVAGLMGGFGMDGFVTSHLSFGAELGGTAITAFGKTSPYQDPLATTTSSSGLPASDPEHDEGFLSVYTALQMTVWR